MDTIKHEKIAVDYFCNLTDLNNIINDLRYVTHMNCLRKCCILPNTLEALNDEQLTNYANFLLNYFESYLSDFEEILRDCETTLIDDKLQFFNDVIYSILNYTHNSTFFCQEFHKQDGLKFVFIYLTILINRTLRIETKNFFTKQAERLAGILFNLSKFRDFYKEEWKELNIFKFLCEIINIVLIENLELFSEVYIVFVTTIAFIYEEGELICLTDVQQGISQISELVGRCALCLSKGEASRKEYKSMNDHEIRFVAHYLDNGWNIIELLECLFRYSIVDHLKWDMYENMRDNLKAIIFYGNDFEIDYALKLLYQLCFDDRVAEDLYRDTELKKYLFSLKENKTKESLLVSCTGIILLSETKPKKNLNTPNGLLQNGHISYNDLNESQKKDITTESYDKTTNQYENPRPKTPLIPPVQDKDMPISKHIMISYNSSSKETCLMIKKELEKNGFKTWIDAETINGSSLESMTKAIEESHCVLMCMTENYKQNSNCRLEAEYSVNLNKPIIPIILEKEYIPDGWLGVILGSKIFIDFTKYSFEECFKRLYREINYLVRTGKIPLPPKEETKVEKLNRTMSISPIVDSFPVVASISIPSSNHHLVPQFLINSTALIEKTKKDVRNWSEEDVNEWIKENKFDKEIVKTVFPCSGEHLSQMYEMYQNIPEYFYNSLNFNKNVYLKDLVHFSSELKKLFNNS